MIFLLGFAITLLVTALYYAGLHAQAQQDIEEIRAVYAERTENLVNKAFHKTDVLVAVAQILGGDVTQEQFDELAQTIYEENAGIRAIEFLPHGVTTYCYPLKGNEKAIGNNVLEMPDRKKDAQLAIDTRSIALSGPYELTQGGLGVVARNPIFLKDAKGNESFWGFAVMVLDLPDAINAAELDSIPKQGYDFQLYAANDNGERVVIAGDAALDTDDALCSTIQVPHHNWVFAVKSKSPWAIYLKAGLMLLVGTLLSFGLAQVYRTALLKSSNRSKNQFMSNMSHDMRTPLNAIVGFSTLGNLSEDLAASKEYHQKVGEAAKYLLSLVTNILEVGKCLHGRVTLSPTVCRAATAIDEAVILVTQQEQTRQLELQIVNRVPEDFWTLLDAEKLTRVCANLMDNAVRCTPAGGTVRFLAELKPDRNGWQTLQITVSDSGAGLSPEEQKKLFIPFAEGYPGSVEGAAGTELGLVVVKQLVTLMSGEIVCTSEINKGTQFVVRIPLQAAEAPTAPVGAPVRDALRGRRILIVEDNEINRSIAQSMLSLWGIETDCAENGALGVEKFETAPAGYYDAVLMDLMMPVLDGLSATKKLRALDRPDARSIPVLALTANAFEDDVRACLAAGMNAHIAKPIDAALLYDTLVRCIAEAEQA